MALAGTAAKLLASLDLDTRGFEAGARRTGTALGKMESRFSKIGGLAQKGLANAATNITRLGIVAAGFITGNVIKGVQSLEDLERVTNATKGVIASTGGVAKVTAQQVRDLANSLEGVTTADDKVIQSGENLLLTFTGIGKDVFPQATKAMVDLGIAMAQGDVANADFKASAIQIGKALNDPVRGFTALRRVGVSFTAQQEKQIKAFVKSGDTLSAQKIILKELETEFGKAGAAAGTGFGADMRRFKDAVEDSQQALATGFLPIISKVSKFLTTELVKPETQRKIREFGDGLASGFDKALDFAKQIPWGSIGDALKIGGAGAKLVLDAFSSMPDWVKTAVVTGWGLNKLTGGALGGIVGELGKGLIKGVLGMTAGVVNINAGVVNGGGGGLPGVAGKTGGGLLGTIAKVTIVGMAAGVAADFLLEQSKGPAAQAYAAMGGNGTRGFVGNANSKPVPVRITGGMSPDERQDRADQLAKLNAMDTRLEAVQARLASVKDATNTMRIDTLAATHSGDRDIVSAIRESRSVVNVSVRTSVTANSISRTQYTSSTYSAGHISPHAANENLLG